MLAPVRLLRHPLPISLLILRKKATVLQSRKSVTPVFNTRDYADFEKLDEYFNILQGSVPRVR